MGFLKSFFAGCCLGFAFIIPGVSGGTMALMLGIYKRLLDAANQLKPSTVKLLLNSILRRDFGSAWGYAKRMDLAFLGLIFLGAVMMVVLLSKVMKVVLVTHHDPTYAFFFGLVLISIYFPYVMIRRKKVRHFILIFLTSLLMVGLGVKDKSSAIKKEKDKQSLKADLKVEHVNSVKKVTSANNIKSQKTHSYIYLSLAGVVAISAMILPGISGSFMLLMMGVYFAILSAVVAASSSVKPFLEGKTSFTEFWFNGHFDIITAVVIGVLIGAIFFTRLMSYLLKYFHDGTVACLTGLVLGSLYTIWPFSQKEKVGEKIIYGMPKLPSGDDPILLSAITFIAGSALVLFFVFQDRRKEAKKGAAKVN
ncbi:MAG: DUF368 domain-containing protein [Lentisphaeria bacterium]|nr:DUF368 domain-containing protein [Lentisphaeria bacterium]